MNDPISGPALLGAGLRAVARRISQRHITKVYTRRMPSTDPRHLDALQSLIIWSHRIGRVVAREAGNATPAAQWRALATLAEEGPMRIGVLAAACRVTQPGMTRLVASMTELALVSRAVDGDDPRATLVTITDAGHEAIAGWRRTIRDTLAPRFADLPPTDWDAIERTAAIIAQRTPNAVPESAR